MPSTTTAPAPTSTRSHTSTPVISSTGSPSTHQTAIPRAGSVIIQTGANPDTPTLAISGASALIAVAALCVAYRQYRTSRQQLRADLYDKRFRAYERVRNFITIASKNGKIDAADLHVFNETRNEIAFLFPRRIQLYVDNEVFKKADDWFAATRRLDDAQKNSLALPEEDVQTNGQMLTWFNHELTGVAKRFLPFLDFTKIG